MIPLEQCKRGHLYRLNARNFSFGVFNGKDGFIGIREKFGDEYLATEIHRSASKHFGTATPLEELGVCPVEDLRESGDLICTECRKPAKSVQNAVTGHYDRFHEDGTPTCKPYSTAYTENTLLYGYLRTIGD